MPLVSTHVFMHIVVTKMIDVVTHSTQTTPTCYIRMYMYMYLKFLNSYTSHKLNAIEQTRESVIWNKGDQNTNDEFSSDKTPHVLSSFL